MKQKQLTAQICAAYFGCEVRMDLIETSIGVMLGMDTKYITVYYNTYRLSHFVSFNEAKLVLRRLESLTDDEALHIHRSMFPESMELDFEGIKLNIENLLQKSTWGFVPSNTRNTIDYLRSIKIDIGYGDIPSLIDAGLAIEKKP